MTEVQPRTRNEEPRTETAMNANDVARQKYLQLINQVEDLEDEIEKVEKQPVSASTQKKLMELKEELAKQRTELARVSDGCGTPHAH